MARPRILVQLSLVLVAAAVLFPLPANANTGVPMLFVTWPVMLLALIPIIGVEAYVLSSQLGLSVGVSLKVASIINAASTIVGIPVAWLLLLLAQLFTGGGSIYGIETAWKKFLAVTWQAPWLIPYEDDMDWMVPSAGLALLVPFFFASWWIEYQVAVPLLDVLEPRTVRHSLLVANLATYGILGLLALGLLATALKLPSRLSMAAKSFLIPLWSGKRFGDEIMGGVPLAPGSQARFIDKSKEEPPVQGSPALTGEGDD